MDPQDTKLEIKIQGSSKDVDEICSTFTIRRKCLEIYLLALEGGTNFKLNLNKLDEVAQYVIDTIFNHYPTLNIPFFSQWNHFQTGQINRMLEFKERTETLSLREMTKAKTALIIINILLEGYAGLRWRYREEKKEYSRSEGQAIACFRMYMSGLFSNDPTNPLFVHGSKLKELTITDLEKAFQSNETNLLNGLEGRLKILHKLGEVIQSNTHIFGSENPRLGSVIEYFLERSSCNGDELSAAQIFRTVPPFVGMIIPGPVEVAGVNVGDVSIYKPFGEGMSALIPFHKLSLWLTYSLFEPLIDNNINVIKTHELTGLAEYKNGGLMIDTGLLQLKDPTLKDVTHSLQSELIIEWRALTIILLDEISKIVARKLGKSAIEFPLVRVLEGGTWRAGRALAQKLREDGSPPLRVHNGDGLVF